VVEVSEVSEEQSNRKIPRFHHPTVREAEKIMERVLGVRVRIKDRKGRGKIVLEYKTLDDFDRICHALGANR
jgi:ParB family chromosome partitioning protein